MWVRREDIRGPGFYGQGNRIEITEDGQSLNTSMKDICLVMVMNGICRTKERVHGALSLSRCSHICSYSLITTGLKA